jgi:hypothetical protein
MQLSKLSRRVVAVPMPAPPHEVPTPKVKQPEPAGNA